MKIIHIIGTLNKAGIQKYILELSRTPELIKYDFQVLCSFKSQDNYKDEYLKNNFTIKYLPFTYLPTHWLPFRLDKLFRNLFKKLYIFRLWFVLVKSDINIVHTHIHCHIVSQILASVLSGKRIIWTIHGEYSLSKITIWLVRILDAILSRIKFHIIADSKPAILSTLPYFIKKLNTDDIIPTGINLELFNQQYDKSLIRRKYNITGDEVLIGSTGRIVWQKGFDQLIKLLVKHTFSKKQIRFLIAGDGSLRNSYIQKIKDLGLVNQISFIGNIKNIPEFLASLDFYIQPSVTEGFPLSVLEAMASGLPVLCSDAGGLKDMIQNGYNGVLYESNNLNSLYSGITDLLSMSKDELFVLGKNASNTVQNNYSIQNSALKYESRYNINKRVKTS
ncbi:MAG: glycosyltransferase family 4 protein [Candidatus Marinimicrobia bacterium]|nr:glycosyltransferase family 4 protein [Candidatus Neomarinimicrobiota bacterium]